MTFTTTTVWNRFRKLRIIVLSLASILSLIWAIIVAVYMASNWSGYNTSQRGFLFGLIALDFVGAILLYLMIVVRYTFWPDAVRTAVLLGLHVAGAVVFTILHSKFPCTAFGSTKNCHMMTIAVLVGSWTISALIFMYAIYLPVMAVIPPPQSSSDDDLEILGDTAEVQEIWRESHVSSSSRALLLKNEEGMSPEVHASELPLPPEMPAALSVRSNTSSHLLPQAMDDSRIELETQSSAPVYSGPSPRFSVAKTIRVSDNPDRSLDPSGASSSGQYLSRSNRAQSSTLPDRPGEFWDTNRASALDSFYGSIYEHPAEALVRNSSVASGRSSSSTYSQNTMPARGRSTSASRAVGVSARADASQTSRSKSATLLSMRNPLDQSYVHPMTARVHSQAERQSAYDIPSDGLLSPPLADPSPRFSLGTFEHDFSDFPRDTERGLVRNSKAVRPRLYHVRVDSTTSSVDLGEWRKLVLVAAGRED